MKRTAPKLRLSNGNLSFGGRALVMGILNVTPDSFSDGGIYLDKDKAVARGLDMAAEGADILDIGGESSRPGSLPVSAEVEIERVVPVIRALRREIDLPLSIDTTKAAVARAAFEAGAGIVNDISALRFDPDMAATAARFGAAVILMHMQGTPQTMQDAPHYEDVLGEVRGFLKDRIHAAVEAGLPEESLAVDPGIGFGKRLEDNLALIDGLDAFLDLGRPVCVGVSRKAFIGRILDLPASDRLEGTIAAAVLCADRGAHILRVHDVGAVRRALHVAEAVKENVSHAG
ncbi:MAG: dihydropteroate synthase [Acidobacteriota bacterium]|nr:dihydropteroate synthase [Acidobacteriota bacterium]